ncbi:DUF4238 domain-containing protein [Thiotrichales bacterium 19X7-9]|nr:DUF4238 domain-containing protein [Thiotrichales bacterium 19X7-9]
MASYKKNHFIPKTYLKQWFWGKDNKFKCAKLDSSNNLFGKFEIKNTGNINCFSHKLYWLITENHDYRVSLEKKFSEIESKFGNIIKKIKHKCELTAEESKNLLEFIIGLRVRTPAIINKQREIFNETNLKATFFKNGLSFDDYYRANVEYDLLNLGLNRLKNIFETNAYLKFITSFGKEASFNIITLNTAYKLITSNYPVIYARNLISDSSNDLMIPLSPNHICFMVSSASLDKFRNILNNRTHCDFVINSNIAVLKN